MLADTRVPGRLVTLDADADGRIVGKVIGEGFRSERDTLLDSITERE